MSNHRKTEQHGNAAPQIVLPKGGGAIRGIAEKFSVNAVTGTGTMSVPIATSPSRSGFGPQLSLSYDSGNGNGPFGFGWTLPNGSIARKTDKGLPRYDDDAESDVFTLSGAEDLVPVLLEDGGELIPHTEQRTLDGATYTVQRYRPRIEGLFARIERWTRNEARTDVFWRVITRDNVTTWYGKTEESRIADPADPRRIFRWLVCESYDDKGNAVRYRYKAEDSTGVDSAAQAHERNRSSLARTAGRYLKRILYGNRTPRRAGEELATRTDWLFEVVFDYGEHYTEGTDAHTASVRLDEAGRPWNRRPDPFSSCRAGFEVRTARLCRRVLMFHHFPDELGTPDYLVRSTDFHYRSTPIGSFITEAIQSGYVRRPDGSYLKKSLPPLALEYSPADVHEEVREVGRESLENLPAGTAVTRHQWLDLDGEGAQGVLAQYPAAWYYKRNVSPLSLTSGVRPPEPGVRFDSLVEEATLPTLAEASPKRHRFLDLAGDGRLDCVVLDQPVPGFFRRTDDERWGTFTPLPSLPNVAWDEPNLRFMDLTGDGLADIVVTEEDALTWYPSRGEEGFGPRRRVARPRDEDAGPAVAFADAIQTIFVADMNGDGLADIVRIRSGEVCYWPSLGYGAFGAKVTMDGAPWFDAPDLFEPRRVRLTDIDGSGTTDIIYLASTGVRLYFNQSGNSWSGPRTLSVFPHVDDVVSIQAVDLLGNGTACLVWASPLPSDGRRSMRYVDLMGGQKPHLLTHVANNLGAETQIAYAPSTKFYLADKEAGRPWITRLPFPVQVVERVVTLDRISGNRFVSRSTYHHGYFDGAEREFRGFGMVEQLDTEEFAALDADQQLGPATNVALTSHVPPVLTRTWFHTGIFVDGGHVSDYFAGLLDAEDRGEYFREPGLDDEAARTLLLEDSVLPAGLSAKETRDACRALKTSVLRREVYALDGSDKEPFPYTVTEESFTVKRLQPQRGSSSPVFLTHSRESIGYHYERDPADPRVTHGITLEVDGFGNVLTATSVVYGRREADAALEPADQQKQRALHISRSENALTNGIDEPDAYRTPLPSESRTFELTGLSLSAGRVRFSFDELRQAGAAAAIIEYEVQPTDGALQKRTIGHTRTVYRADDLSGALPLGRVQPLTLPFESYTLAFTPGLVGAVFGTKVTDGMLGDVDQGAYVHSQGDEQWWIPSGRVFFSAAASDDAPSELAEARAHFFLPRLYRDPFGNTTLVSHDRHDLLTIETRDAVENIVTAVNDYRVLQPRLVTDPNGNRAAASFDALGMIVGTAVMGKPAPAPQVGDRLDGFEADLTDDEIAAHLGDPFANPHAILARATTRLVYDLFAYARTRSDPAPTPSVVYSLIRETHDADLQGTQSARIQHAFSYSDGFGRVIQTKAQAPPGPIADGLPTVDPRWLASGWTIFDNKGQPVRHFEPFFTPTFAFEFDVRRGVSPITFYDPVGRTVGTLHPDHTWQKTVFDPWRQETWDVTDTVLVADPRTDPDVGGFFRRLDEAAFLPTWHAQRQSAGADPLEQDAAAKTAIHAATPAVAYADSLGRTFLTIAHNRLVRGGTTVDELHASRVEVDIEGNERTLIDARGRQVVEHDYNLVGARIRQSSMEAGVRWMLNNLAGAPIRAWDSRGNVVRRTYDRLQRPLDGFLSESHGPELLIARAEYGETQPDAESHNLRGRLFRQFDQAGVMSHPDYDFKGNLLSSSRQFAASYKDTVNWLADPALEPETFTASTTFDALNRPTSMTNADGSVYAPFFGVANQLEAVDVTLPGAQAATRFVTRIDYNAQGQRARIDFGNGTTTSYTYDPLTFRLRRLVTVRSSDQARLQDLAYAHDPAGNITHISDGAQQTIYFNNQVVAADNDYTYDALSRLIHAAGREHIGQATAPQTTWDDRFRLHQPAPTDGQAMRTYVEHYDYDAVGNFVQVVHEAVNGNWTRGYAYDEASLLDPAARSNRLSATTVGAGTPELYTYDLHGNMTSMPHLTVMRWNYRDELQATSTQAVTSGTPETTFYVYDAAGRRIRKVTERQNGTRARERIYLRGLDVYREYDGAGTSMTLERESVHVMDDRSRIALVETRTEGSDAGPPKLFRYQFGNHLSSVSLELDEQSQVISYEEYYPYGGTAYQAAGTMLAAGAKRYRYGSQERDEESGFYHNGSRYYASWLGCWTSCDPSGTVGGINLYRYASANPVMLTDPGGRQPKKAGKVGEVNPHGEQGLRGKGTATVLESEHMEPIAVQRENMKNPGKPGGKTPYRSPIPLGRNSQIDKAQPTVMLDKATADAKTALDRPVITAAKRLNGRIAPPDIAAQFGPDAGLARAEQAARITGTRLPAGAYAAVVGQTDALHADPNVRAFSRNPLHNPLIGATDDEVCRAVDDVVTSNSQRAGNMTRLAATKDPGASSLFRGTYSEVSATPTASTPASTPRAPAPTAPAQSSGGWGRGLMSVGLTTLKVVGSVLAVKGAVDDFQEEDYFGSALNVGSLVSAPTAIINGAYHVNKAQAMAIGAIYKAEVDSTAMYAAYIQDQVTPQEVVESRVDLSSWPARDRQEVYERYMNGE